MVESSSMAVLILNVAYIVHICVYITDPKLMKCNRQIQNRFWFVKTWSSMIRLGQAWFKLGIKWFRLV